MMTLIKTNRPYVSTFFGRGGGADNKSNKIGTKHNYYADKKLQFLLLFSRHFRKKAKMLHGATAVITCKHRSTALFLDLKGNSNL